MDAERAKTRTIATIFPALGDSNIVMINECGLKI
jgi:hypothetical protein